MISSEAQRTLVKSPPELWSELSEPTSLSRHLVELGDVRITDMEPESTVEWEAELLSGTVKLEPSGWGTKVTLTVNRELPAVEDVVAADSAETEQAEPPLDAEPTAEGEVWAVQAAETEPALEAEQGPVLTIEPEVEPEAKAKAPDEEPAPRKGFFARLFRSFKGRAETPQDVLPAQAEAGEPAEAGDTAGDAAPLDAPEPVEAKAAELDRQDAPEQSPDLSAELIEAEESIVAKDTAVLMAVLDRLGAAHHRPFSRA